MTSRKQKIKEKRSQEEKEAKQVQIAVAGFAGLLLIAIAVYVLINSGVFDPPFEALTDYSGTATEICEQATPAEGTGTDAQPYFRIFNPMSQSKKHATPDYLKY